MSLDGVAREILYAPDYFTIGEGSPARHLPSDANGFAGFWLQESRFAEEPRRREIWASFLGAAYFRAVSGVGQWGMSARGVALDVGGPSRGIPGLRRPLDLLGRRENDPVVVHSLLDGPSLAGAFRFAIARTTGTVMEIENHLFARRDIERLGIAPLTAMFWFSEYGRERLADWRPEVHDADALVIWNGAGERLFRPLNNPTRIFHTSYLDNDPKGFGLAQRDRDFDHYLDGVRYDQRPTVWVEPLDGWGKGWCSWSRSRPTTRSTTTSAPTGCPRSRRALGTRSASATDCTGWTRNPAFRSMYWPGRSPRIGRGGQSGKPRPMARPSSASSFRVNLWRSCPATCCPSR